MKPTPSMPVVCPEPGIYEDVPASEYHSWSAVSSSLLKHAFLSGQKARHYLHTPQQPTAALCIGTCIDIAITAPEHYHETVQFIKLSERSGPSTWANAVEKYGSQAIAPLEYEDRIERIVANVLHNEAAVALMDGDTRRQLIVVWDDEMYGLRCKAMIDLCRLDGEQIHACDVKSSKADTESKFAADCANYCYDMQAAHYLTGLRAAGEFDPLFKRDLPPRWSWLVVEKTAPYECIVFDDTDDESSDEPNMYRCGMGRRAKALGTLAHSLAKGIWTSKSYGQSWPIAPPMWLRKQWGDDGNNG